MPTSPGFRPSISRDPAFAKMLAELPPDLAGRVAPLRRFIVRAKPRRRVIVPVILALDALAEGDRATAEQHLAAAEAGAEELRAEIDARLAVEGEAAARRREHKQRLLELARQPTGRNAVDAVLTVGVRGQITRWRAAGGPLIAATDAAKTSGARVVGYGYVTSDGRYGIGGHTYPPPKVNVDLVLVGELRAVWFLLTGLDRDAEATVLVDSDDALEFLRGWRQGKTNMPRGYPELGGNDLFMYNLAARLARTHPRVAFEQVRGHSGHVLNEAADALAVLAKRRLMGRWQGDVIAAAQDLADSFTTAWHAGPADLREGRDRP